MSLLIQPSPELQLSIRKELNEDVNTRDSDLQAIKDWLLKQPHLPDTWGKSSIRNESVTCDNNRSVSDRRRASDDVPQRLQILVGKMQEKVRYVFHHAHRLSGIL